MTSKLYADQPQGSRTVEEAYETLAELLWHPAESPDWRQEFNAAAEVLENATWREDEQEVQDGEPTLASTAATIPWQAVLHKEKTYLVTPPLIHKEQYLCRLALPILFEDFKPRGRPNPARPPPDAPIIMERRHIPALRVPPPAGEMDPFGNPEYAWDAQEDIKHAITACIESTGGLPEIFALWDFIARQGVEVALNNHLVDNNWVIQASATTPVCRGDKYAQECLAKITTNPRNTLMEAVEDILFLLPGYADLDPKDVAFRLPYKRYVGDTKPFLAYKQRIKIIQNNYDQVMPVLATTRECHPQFATAIAVYAADHAQGTHERTIGLLALDFVGLLAVNPAIAIANRSNDDGLIGAWAARAPIVQHLLDRYGALKARVALKQEEKRRQMRNKILLKVARQNVETGRVAFDSFANAFARRGRGPGGYMPPQQVWWDRTNTFIPEPYNPSIPESVFWDWNGYYYYENLECKGPKRFHEDCGRVRLEWATNGKATVYGNFFPPECPGLRTLLEEICRTKHWPYCTWTAYQTHPDLPLNDSPNTKRESRIEKEPRRSWRKYVVLARSPDGKAFAASCGHGERRWPVPAPYKPCKRELHLAEGV